MSDTAYEVTVRVLLRPIAGDLPPNQIDWDMLLGDDRRILGGRFVSARALELKTCANETCDRQFVFQEGRAKQGQLRGIGVLYCSARCAKNQAQREYRRRQR